VIPDSISLAYASLGIECVKRADFHVQKYCTRPNASPDFVKALEYFPVAIEVVAKNPDQPDSRFFAPWAADGRTQLALMHLNGEGTEVDIPQAITLLEAAFEHEQSEKKTHKNTGQLYITETEGFEFRRIPGFDFPNERSVWWSAGQKAAYLLGTVYDALQEYDIAADWYSHAAHDGEVCQPGSGMFFGCYYDVPNLGALERLGQMAFEGEGLPRDKELVIAITKKIESIKVRRAKAIAKAAEPWWLAGHKAGVAAAKASLVNSLVSVALGEPIAGSYSDKQKKNDKLTSSLTMENDKLRRSLNHSRSEIRRKALLSRPRWVDPRR